MLMLERCPERNQEHREVRNVANQVIEEQRMVCELQRVVDQEDAPA